MSPGNLLEIIPADLLDTLHKDLSTADDDIFHDEVFRFSS